MNSVYVFRLEPGQDLKQEIQKFTQAHNIHAGIILTTVGSLSTAYLRFAGAKEAWNRTEKFEILSLVGTISTAGSHLHLTIGDATGQVYGGHLMEGCLIRTTAEIAIMAIGHLHFKRELDPNTGYPELVVEPNLQ